LFLLECEVQQRHPGTRFISCIGNIQDAERLSTVLAVHRPTIVYYAAAHKDRHITGQTLVNAIGNNIFGAETLLKSCITYRAKTFLTPNHSSGPELLDAIEMTTVFAASTGKLHHNFLHEQSPDDPLEHREAQLNMKYSSIQTNVQSNPRPRVLVVSLGRNSRGEIASVVRMHERAPVWRSMQCELLPTFADGSSWCKLKAAFRAYIRAPHAIWGCDLVHIHLAGETSLLRKLPIAIQTKLLRRPLIIHVYAHSPESLFDRTPSWVVSYALRVADRVIALSRSWAASFTLGCQMSRWKLLQIL
jgi:hypothetical protein